jgi:tetratricopeptide (TPR) repeat protein
VALSPLLFFVTLELGLRLSGFGYPTAFLLPVGINGRQAFIQNDRFAWRFLGPKLSRTPYPLTIAKLKPPDTVRIFVFGESAAAGDPEPDFGLARMLEALLTGRYPGVRFEVVNAAITAINSHAILSIARDCARQHGDIWVVYMGNNEVVGPYGAGTIFGPKTPPLALIRASLALKATRTGQGLERLFDALETHHASADEWEGMAMFTQEQVGQDDRRMAVVYGHFERNLRDILRVGLHYGARIVVSTVTSNLKDCAPFASLHRTTLSAAELAEWSKVYHQATEAQRAGQITEAADCFRQAARIDDGFAEMHFRWGQDCLALGQEAEALRQFTRARDQDALRFRADSRINEIIRETASGRAQEGILFVDGQEALARQSPHGLTGEELLYEHVHLKFEGNYLLGRTIVESVAALLPETITGHAGAVGRWPTMEECARRLAWTDWNRYEAEAEIFARSTEAPFTSQFNHAEQSERSLRKIEQLLPAIQPAGLKEAVSRCREALAIAPDDWVLQRRLALLQNATGDFPGAEDSWRRLRQLMPRSTEALQKLGETLAMENRDGDAIAAFQEILRLDDSSVSAFFVMGQVFTRQGKNAEARHCFERALELKPDSSLAHWRLGETLESLGEPEEAQRHFHQALQRRTRTLDALNILGRVCFDKGWFREAATNYLDVIRINPLDAPAYVSLGRCLESLGNPEEAERSFSEALRLNPNLSNAHFRLGMALAHRGDDAGALKQFAETVRLTPDSAEARLNLGILLMNQSRRGEALEQFQEVLRRDPVNATALKGLQVLAGNMPAEQPH